MQETPQFETIKQRFSGYRKEQILGTDSNNQAIQGPDAEVIEQIFQSFPLYFSDNAFRQKLTIQAKQTVESQISAACDQFDQIIQNRQNGSLTPNLQNFINNLSAYFEEFRNRFINPRRIDTLEGGTDTTKTIQKINDALKEATATKESIEEVLKTSEELASYKAATELANYFYKIHSGRTLEDAEKEDDKRIKNKIKIKKPTWLHIVGALLMSALIAVSFPAVKVFIDTLTPKARMGWTVFFGTIAAICLVYSIYFFTIKFNQRYVGGYERASKIWGLIVIFSLFFVGAYSFGVIKALNLENGVKIEEAVIKAVLLIAPLYLVRFAVRNFNANKHLSSVNEHRATSIRVSELFIKGIDERNNSAYVELVRLLFAQEETGFLTRRDGAGSNDSTVDIRNFGSR